MYLPNFRPSRLVFGKADMSFSSMALLLKAKAGPANIIIPSQVVESFNFTASWWGPRYMPFKVKPLSAAATVFNSRRLTKPLTVSDRPSSEDGAKVRVAYQGIAGAFSEAAALKAYPMSETVPCDDFEAAFEAVELCLVDKAVVPIENSVAGSIHRVYDLLLRHRLHIVGELQLEDDDQCLLGLPDTRKEELNRAISHHPLKLGILGVDTLNQTGQQDYEEEHHHSVTRFIILAREPLIPGTNPRHKTSIVFALEEGPAALFKALAVFTHREINLRKIESRPHNRNRNRRPLPNKEFIKFDYLFYIDFDASMAEPRAQNAMGHLQEYATFQRVLGCYPMDTSVVP